MVANKGGSAEYIKNTAKSNVANKELLFFQESAHDWILDAVITQNIESDWIVAIYIYAHQTKADPWPHIIDRLAELLDDCKEDLPEKFRQDPLAYREFLKGYVKSEVDYFVTMNWGRCL